MKSCRCFRVVRWASAAWRWSFQISSQSLSAFLRSSFVCLQIADRLEYFTVHRYYGVVMNFCYEKHVYRHIHIRLSRVFTFLSNREDSILENILDRDRGRISLLNLLISLSIALLLRFTLSTFFSEFGKGKLVYPFFTTRPASTYTVGGEYLAKCNCKQICCHRDVSSTTWSVGAQLF